MGFNLTNEFIDQTFEQLTQISGSQLVDGTGSLIDSLTITASHADNATTASYALNSEAQTSASYAESASHAESADLATLANTATTATTATTAGSATTATSASHAEFAVTSSFALNFNPSATASYADNAMTASYALTASYSNNSISASHAVQADNAITATTSTSSSFATIANSALSSSTATSASHAVQADSSLTATSATTATSASHAVSANTSISASHAVQADSALTATTATTATSASYATIANSALSSTTATSASHAVIADSSITATSATTATSASHAVQADSATSSSHAVNADSAISSSYVTGQENFARTNVNNVFTGTQTFNNIAVNGTGSFGYLESITGSAKVIGDAFLILNNDTPTQRYAGIKVIDSGSSNTTGSLIWDGDSNEWKYEYSASAGHEAAVVLMGPEMADIGTSVYPTANQIQKGTGGHHLTGSNITDDGSLVKINSNTQITGSTNVTGSLINQGRFTNNNIALGTNQETDLFNFPGFTKATGVNAGNTYNVNHFMYNNYQSFGSGYYENSYVFEIFDSYGYNYGGELHIGGDILQMRLEPSGSGADGKEGMFKVIDLGNNAADVIVENSTDNGRLALVAEQNGASIQFSGSVDSKNGITAPSFTGSLLGTASHAANAGEWDGSYLGNASITGSLIVSGGNFDVLGATRNGSSIDSNFKQNLASPGLNLQYDLINVPSTTIDNRTYTNVNNFFADYSGFGSHYKDYFAIEYYDSFSYNYGSEFSVNGIQARMLQIAGNQQLGDIKVIQKKPADIANGRGTVSGSHAILQARGTGSQALINSYDGASVQIQAVGQQGGDPAYMQLLSTGSTTIHTQTDSLTLKSGTSTGGFYLNVTGSVAQPTASVNINSNTGSLENFKSNFHSLTLVSGSDTHLKMQTTHAGRPGQTISLEVKQPTTATDSYGTLSFAPEYKFAGGTAPTITAASGALDVLTFQTYDGSTYYGTAIQNFS